MNLTKLVKAVKIKLSEDISNIDWFHGGEKKYDHLIEGDGIDGPGIYLTKDRKRAEMYAKRDNKGKDRSTTYIHKVRVKINPKNIWSDEKKYDLRDYTKDQWLTDMIEKYGEKSAIMNGGNAKIYLGWKDNKELKKMGYDAILHSDDLIILNPKVIMSVE